MGGSASIHGLHLVASVVKTCFGIVNCLFYLVCYWDYSLDRSELQRKMTEIYVNISLNI